MVNSSIQSFTLFEYIKDFGIKGCDKKGRLGQKKYSIVGQEKKYAAFSMKEAVLRPDLETFRTSQTLGI